MKKFLALLLSAVMMFTVVCLAACAKAGPIVTFRTTAERKLGEKEAVDGVVDPAGVGGTPADGWMFRWETGKRETNDKGEETLILSGEAFDFSNVTEDVTVYQRIIPQPGVGRYFIAGGTATGGPGWKPDKLEEGNEWLMDYDETNEVYTQTITMTEKAGFRVLDNTGAWNSLYNGTHVTEVTIADDVTCADYYPEIKMGAMGEDTLFYTGAGTDFNIELNVAITSITIVVTVDVLNNAMKLHITELTIPDPAAGPKTGSAVVGKIFDGACGGEWFGSKVKAELETGLFDVDDDSVATGTIQVTNGDEFKVMKDTKIGWGSDIGFNAAAVVTFAEGVDEIAGFLSDKGGNNLVTMPEGKVATVVVTMTADFTISFKVTAVKDYILVGGGLADGELNFGLTTRFDNTASGNTIIDAEGELVEWTLTGVGIFKIMQTDDANWTTALGFACTHEVELAEGVEYPEGTTADTFLTDDGNFKMGVEGYTTVFTIDFDMATKTITINVLSITAIAA